MEARFRQRVGDIEFWKGELEAKLAELKDVAGNLDSQAGRVEQALVGCSEPLDVAEKCLAHRCDHYVCLFFFLAILILCRQKASPDHGTKI